MCLLFTPQNNVGKIAMHRRTLHYDYIPNNNFCCNTSSLEGISQTVFRIDQQIQV